MLIKTLFCSDIELVYVDTIEHFGYEYCVEFNNNQNRELRLYSDYSFDFLKKGQTFIFEVRNVLSYRFILGDEYIEYSFCNHKNEKLLEYWLFHVVFPIFLVFRDKRLFLHSGAVSYGDTALVFLANSFGGKSTITDFFLKKGHLLVTDDKLLIDEADGTFYAVPSFAYHRPFRDFETLGIYTKNFDPSKRKIRSMYVLKKADADASVSFEKIKGVEKFQILKGSIEFDFYFMFEKNSKYLAKMCNHIELFYVMVPWNIDRLNEVYEKIILHQKEIANEV